MTRLGKQPDVARPTKSSQRQQPAGSSTKRFSAVTAKPRAVSKRAGAKISRQMTCPQHVFGKVAELFSGNTEAAWDWLTRPAAHLHWKTPLEAAQTERGAEEVVKMIGRIAHGILA